MNGPHDLDRRLDDWFADGPAHAPERSISAALDHARTHPRRRDPFAALRRDPMSAGGFGAATGVRALSMVAVLGLILVAAVAAATVGGLFEQRPVTVPPAIPGPSGSPAPSSPASQSPAPAVPAPPSAAPTGPALPASFHVTLAVKGGSPISLSIFDDSGALLTATSGTPADGASVGDGVVAVANDPSDPNTIVLTWSGTPCDTSHTLNISQDARTFAIERPACSGDLLPLDRILRLTFDRPIAAASVTATITTVGS
jgi:hypothetical protein